MNIRAFHTLRLLARDFDITGLFFYRRMYRGTTGQVSEAVEGLRPYATVEAFPIPQEWSRARLLADHVRSTLGRRVYTRFTYESRAFRTRLEELLASRSFDLVHLDSLDLSAYLPLLERSGVPIICAHHNVESLLLSRRSSRAESAVTRLYLKIQGELYAREEAEWMPRVALNVAVSPDDAHEFNRRVPRARIAMIPSGVDMREPDTSAKDVSGVVFVGGLDWFPNRDALEWYADAILPLLRETHHGIRSVFVGRSTAEDRARFAALGIELTGHVQSIDPYLAAATCFIVPLRIGGGTRLKVLDGWAFGKAVVSTGVGCEGLETHDGENILVRDSPADFAAAVSSVLGDSELRTRLERGGRATVAGRYSWEEIGASIREIFGSLVPARSDG